MPEMAKGLFAFQRAGNHGTLLSQWTHSSLSLVIVDICVFLYRPGYLVRRPVERS